MPPLLKRLGTGLFAGAAILSLAACAAQPQHPQAGQNRQAGATHESANPPSLSALESAYKHNGNSAEAAQAYAQALREHDRLQRAVIVLSPFIQEPSPSASILTEYGAVQGAMGNDAAAKRYARKALAKDPKDGKAYRVLGNALDSEGQHDKAELAFRKALANWTGDPTLILNDLGLNLAAQGFLTDAVDTMEKAAAASPDNMDIARNLRIVKAMLAQSPKDKRIVTVPVPPPKPSFDAATAPEKTSPALSRQPLQE